MRSKSVILAVVLLGSLAAAGLGWQAPPKQHDGVFVHLSHGSDDPHRVVMALTMASMMAKDHDVLVYFDIKGIGVVLRSAEDIKHAQFASSKKLLEALRANGVLLMACPGCLKAAGKTPADLAPGIRIADKKSFFSFTRGRILSLDY